MALLFEIVLSAVIYFCYCKQFQFAMINYCFCHIIRSSVLLQKKRAEDGEILSEGSEDERPRKKKRGRKARSGSESEGDEEERSSSKRKRK